MIYVDKSQDRASLLTSSFHLLPSISAYTTKTLTLQAWISQ